LTDRCLMMCRKLKRYSMVLNKFSTNGWLTSEFVPRVVLPAVCMLFLLSNCKPKETPLFERIKPEQSGISFQNNLTVTQEHNIYHDSNFYAGGGVGLGDISGNGLPDIYMVSNQGSNRLFLNKGDFNFEDVTEQAGVGGSKPWSTGVSFVDINGNGLLDIYVTNSGPGSGEDRMNELFINNGDMTFTEQARAFGIADSGYSIHAAFFDFDNDGDLDMYLVNNHAYQPISAYDLSVLDRRETDYRGGDRFYRNDGGVFTDITEEAGIYSSGFSFGLGASVGDLTRNGFMDIYVSNDFFERDYLYINNGDGTFSELIEEKLSSISTTSMGGDIADLDNDGFPEIFITDMLPKREKRLKMISDFIDWEQYQEEIELGYHRKFTRNTLQYNHSDGTFSEIGRYSGVEASDWSWGALVADFNLNGLRDIYVPNGFYKDVTDKDYMLNIRQQDVMRPDGQLDYVKLVELTPTTPILNYMFENLGGLQFASSATEWGLDIPGFSHGAAYGDLNGNGALDLVVNNVNMEMFIYRNRSSELYPGRSWLQIQLTGEGQNTLGVGAQVELVSGSQYWYAEQMPQRSFQSSMDPVLHVGLGEGVNVIDSLEVRWPDGRINLLTEVDTRQRIKIHQHEASGSQKKLQAPVQKRMSANTPLIRDITDQIGLDWSHSESGFDDFSIYPLLFEMRSAEGPPVCTGDLNGNGREDFFVGGARGKPGALFFQGAEGRFLHSNQPALETDSESEDTACLIFDADGNGNLTLYVASGSSEFMAGNPALADRLYRFNEDGMLVRDQDALPEFSGGNMPTGVVKAADVNGNGFMDLFVGIRMIPPGAGVAGGFGVPVSGYLLQNDGNGRFEDVTDELAPGLRADELKSAGLTSAEWGDLTGNGLPDLIVAGEWMPLTIFYNNNGELERANPEETGLADTRGWWKSLALADLTGNGLLDFVAGNHGLNSRFRASMQEPLQFWAGDFNNNGMIEHLIANYNDGGPYPVAQLNDLLYHITNLRGRVQGFEDYAERTVNDLFTQQELDRAHHYQAEMLESVIGWNDGNGSFQIEKLPDQAQWAPVYSILPADLNGSGTPEIMIGGNLDAVRPQAGPYDALFGLVLSPDSEGNYQTLKKQESGFFSDGEIRFMKPLKTDSRTIYIVSRNNRELQFFEVSGN
jgi:enediyne biosynthesis protein E4